MIQRRHKRRGGVFFVDYPVTLTALFIALFVLTTAPSASKPHITTYGQYAIVMTWPGASRNDIDLYVRDPAHDICYFNSAQVDGLQLEHDDLGYEGSGYQVAQVHVNEERTIIRTIAPGEYVVNVQEYRQATLGATPVTVTLWRLRGNDVKVHERKLVIPGEGNERTAFRFTLDRNGNVSGYDELPLSLFGNNVYSPPPGPQ